MKRLRTAAVSFLVAAFIILSSMAFPAIWDRFEVIFHDLRARMFIRDPEITQIRGSDVQIRKQDSLLSKFVFIDIDDYSLSEYGRWPWPRNIMAEFIHKIQEFNPRIVFVDIYYPEPSEDDMLLDEAAAAYGNVGFVYNFLFEKGYEKYNVDDVTRGNIDRWSVVTDAPRNIEQVEYILPTVSPISDHAFLGHDWMLADEDNVFRKVTEYVMLDGRAYLSLPIMLYLQYNGIPVDQVSLSKGKVHIDGMEMPVDRYGQRLVDYYSSYRGYDKFRHIPFADIMNGRAQVDLTDKIAFVGMTARGLASAAKDIKMTPVGEMPGMEYLANATLNIFQGRFIVSVPRYVNYLAVLLIAGLLSLFGHISKGWKNIALAVLLMLTVIIVSFILYDRSVYIRMAEMLSAVFVIYLTNTFFKYVYEENQKRVIRGMFSSYVSEAIVSELIQKPELAKIHGEKRDMTVLFSDVKSFTTYSESHPAEYVVTRLNEYVNEMTNVIMRQEGTLEKCVGDEIMVLFGAPIYFEGHADKAVETALAMRSKIREMQNIWRSQNKDILDMGIGINTGQMLVGNIGAEGKKRDYTVIGDNVNLGARIEALTRVYSVNIVITENTYNELRTHRERCREIDLVRVKGKNEPTRIFQVLDSDVPQTSLVNFASGLAEYRKQNWEKAESYFRDVMGEVSEEGLCRLFLARIAHFKKNPPSAQWDGVFTKKEE